jgi:hypothetical protein
MADDGIARGGASNTSLVVNVGCGPVGASQLPPYFGAWRQLRVDADPTVAPDLVADLTDLSQIVSGSARALWAAHCIEHLYAHQVERALSEFYRVLDEDGFVIVLVPDLQTIANFIVSDRLHETIYQSAAGPVTAHDVLFGFGPAVALGRERMAHRCGFTPTLMLKRFESTPFAEIVVRRRPALMELAVFARKRQSRDVGEREALLTALGL